MARNTQHTEITLSMSASQAQAAIDSLSKKSEDLRAKLQAAVDTGNKADAKKLQSELNKVSGQLRRMQTETAIAEETLKNLDSASPNELKKTLSVLRKEIGNVSKDSPRFAELAEKIRSVKEAIKETNEAMKPQPGLWDRIKNAGTGAVAVYQTAISWMMDMKDKMGEYVEEYAGMQEEMAGVSKYSGLAAEDVEALNDEFKKMDTRTSREDLNRLAQDAGRLGKQSVDDILGFVRAADQINVALDDLGDGATLTLSKITGLFGIEAEYGTEQALLKTGSVINDLSQNCSAGAGYIAEFTSRLSATGKQANLTIPQIMAYAAVMDESAVNVEQSSTAVSKLIIHLLQEPAKYAKVAGLEVKEWTELMRKDANEGFLQFVDALNKKGGLDKMAPLFKEMGENGIGAMNALGLLATQIDKVRAQQDAANESFELGTSISNEFGVANTTVAAELDKNKNLLHETQVEIGEKLLPVYNLFAESSLAVAKATSWLISTIMENKAVILTAAAAIGVYNVAINLAAIKTVAFTAIEKAKTIAMSAGRVVTLACSVAYHKLQGNIYTAKKAQQELNAVINLSKLGIAGLSIVIAAGAAALIKYALSFTKASIAAEGSRKAQETLLKIQKEAVVQAEEQKQKVLALVAAAQNETLSLKDRHSAIAQLNKIVPGYNAQLDSTSGKYRANKKALDDYLSSLVKLYEIQGAKDTLAALGKQKADLKFQKEQAKDNLNEINKSRPSYTQPATSSGGGMPGITFNFGWNAGLAAGYETDIANIDKKLSVIEAQEKRIWKVYGDDIQKQAVKESAPEVTDPSPAPSGGSGGGGKSGQSKAEKAAAAKSKREAEAAKKRAEKKQKEEFKKGLEEIEKERNEADAVSIGLYKSGAATLSEYQERLHEAETKMFDDKIAYYEKAGLQEDEDVSEFRKKREQADLKYQEKRQKASAAEIKREQERQEMQAEIDYVTPGNAIYKNEEALQERLFRLKVYYIYRTRDLYQEGSDEYIRLTEEAADAEQAEALRKQKATAELISKYSLDYKKQDIDARERMELSALEALHNAGKLSEIEYQKALQEIRERFRKEREDADPNAAKTKTTKDYSASSEWASLVVNMNDALQMQLDSSESKLVAWSKKVSAISQAAFAAISAVGTQVSSLMSAQIEYETAKIEKEYDARIKAAGKNSKKVKQLEEEKDQEIQKMKAKATKANMAIQIATALAQTAANAISAYGSVVGIPVVGPTLAPIAAALAVAAGMVQVATIRKQAQTAELQGYSDGGYTKRGAKDEPAGIVHAGEWVAPARLVNDPRTAPMIYMLEQARRTNVFPTITPAAVSGALTSQLTQPTISPQIAPETLELLQDSSESKMSIAVAQELKGVIERLRQTLDEGISAKVSIAGRNGIEENTRRYRQLMNNRNIR